jgi:hypothetical protein
MKTVEELKRELGAKSLRGPIKWNGFEVFVPEYKGSPKIGLPYVILKKGEIVRMSTVNESFDFMDWEEQNPQMTKSEDILNGKLSD